MVDINSIRIQIPNNVRNIINTLYKNGYEAYIVGGCVRDAILGREPNDWDITTSALPEQVKGLFSRTIDTGIKHGTVTVMMGKTGYEITTYRIDGEYEDGRHPKSVEYTRKLSEDLKRRDFTINAMAYNDKEGIIDLYNGIDDINNKIIRCVGNAHERFTEDALRILRTVRFSAQLGYSIEEETKKAAFELADNLSVISKERIESETNKLLLSDRPEMINMYYELNIMKNVIPELLLSNNEERILTTKLMKAVSSDRYLRWTALLYNMGIVAQKLMFNLKMDRKTIDIVAKLIKYRDYPISEESIEARKAISVMGTEIALMNIEIKMAYAAVEKNETDIDLYIRTKKEYERIIMSKEPINLSMLAINGNDLKNVGITSGEKIGKALKEALEIVLTEPSNNNKEYLIRIINS